MKKYFVAKIRPWTGGSRKAKEYYQATTNIDCLSCDALSPVKTIQARNQKEAIGQFIATMASPGRNCQG